MLSSKTLFSNPPPHPRRPPTAGFNPTLGPAWVPLYGSPPSGGLRDDLQNLSEGFGQDIWFWLPGGGCVHGGVGRQSRIGDFPGTTGVQLMRKKKAKREHTRAGIPQHLDGSSCANGPQSPSAVEVAGEELLLLSEIGTGG